jgi:hypothetical protein
MVVARRALLVGISWATTHLSLVQLFNDYCLKKLYLGYRFIFPTYFISACRVQLGGRHFLPPLFWLFLRVKIRAWRRYFFVATREKNLTQSSHSLSIFSGLWDRSFLHIHDLVQLGPSINYTISYTTPNKVYN